jgi:hypothetical protein
MNHFVAFYLIFIRYANAIESVLTASLFLSADDLMANTVHSVQVPTKYNFMTVQIPEELQPYVNITPSNYFSETAPMVFDFVCSIQSFLPFSFFPCIIRFIINTLYRSPMSMLQLLKMVFLEITIMILHSVQTSQTHTKANLSHSTSL